MALRLEWLDALCGLPAAIQPGGARYRRGDRAGLRGQGLGVVAWSPLASGYLAGKYKPGDSSRRHAFGEGWGFQGRFFARNHAEILQALLDTARDINRSPAQTALRWAMDQPFMTSAIVGARNAQQLGETLAAGGWRLPEEARAKLDKVSAQPHRYSARFREPMVDRRNAAVKMAVAEVAPCGRPRNAADGRAFWSICPPHRMSAR